MSSEPPSVEVDDVESGVDSASDSETEHYFSTVEKVEEMVDKKKDILEKLEKKVGSFLKDGPNESGFVPGGSGELPAVSSKAPESDDEDLPDLEAAPVPDYDQLMFDEPEDLKSKSAPAPSLSQAALTSEEEELQMQLAMIAQMEECERTGKKFDPTPLPPPSSSGGTGGDMTQLPDGTIYIGQMNSAGVPHGRGIQMDDSFDRKIYEGEYVNGMKQGEGIYYPQKHERIEGHFYKENPHGFCRFFQNNVQTFAGNYDSGVPQGFGVITRYGGFRYEGNQMNMVAEGDGKLFDKDGKLIYEGNFVNNNPHGSGKKMVNGVLWEGEFDAGRMTGIYIGYKDVLRIEARFKEGIQVAVIREDVVALTREQEEVLMEEEVNFYTGNDFQLTM